MKDLIIALAVTAILIVSFSFWGYDPVEPEDRSGAGSRRRGESGLIVPGDGDLFAEVADELEPLAEPSEDERAQKTEIAESAEPVKETRAVAATEMSEQIQEKTRTKEKNEMDGMLLAFWHGVAAVLIGGAGALLAAFAWSKICGSGEPASEDCDGQMD